MAQTTLQERVDRLEIALERLSGEVEETSRSVRQLSLEMRLFKEEMNKRWGDLANRLGTLVEDIVAPALPQVIKRRLGLELDDIMIRRKRRKGELREEFDVIGIAGDVIFVAEVKSQFKADHVDRFSEKLRRFRELFPEYEDKRLIGVIASLYLDEGVIRYATAKGYYAMGMKGDYMDFLNAEELSAG
ncbi:hypothetical protein J7M22_00325 [Candidatus Poribacteria bacterium]|nr:hypothetical protein [Candidatus Poribacteria bacterium]